MELDTLVGEDSLVIDQEYLDRFGTLKKVFGALKPELEQKGRDSMIYLHRPRDSRFNPLFADVLAYVCARAIAQGYTFKVVPPNRYDHNKIVAILGGNVENNGVGYRFKRKRRV